MEAYHFNQREVGLGLALVGLSSALVQGLGLRFVAPKLGEKRAVMLGIAAVCASAVLYNLARGWGLVAVAISIGSFQGFVQPSIAAMNSRAVGAQRQGELQGATQAVNGLAQIVGPLLYTSVFARFTGPRAIAYAPAMPLLLSAVIAVGALALFLAGARRIDGGA
jgi:DHA1 family tetracycline resistance protein-like MFS transporter